MVEKSSRLLVIGTVSALATVVGVVVFVWMVFGISNAGQAFAPPTHCIACATEVEGSGFGTITIPENPEIAPEPCDNCFATISFEAFTDDKGRVQNGTISIEYTASEAVTRTLSGEFFDGVVSKDSFKLLGTIIQAPTICPACADVDFTVKGAIQKGTAESATLTLKAADGTTATFDNVKVTFTTIPSEA